MYILVLLPYLEPGTQLGHMTIALRRGRTDGRGSAPVAAKCEFNSVEVKRLSERASECEKPQKAQREKKQT